MKKREEILEALRRTAEANGDVALGARRFTTETGIREHEWKRYWPRFSDAHREAGLATNRKSEPVADNVLLAALASLTRRLGHRPTAAEIAIAKREGFGLPHHAAFLRLGNYATITERLRDYASCNSEFADILPMLPPALRDLPSKAPSIAGAVYLLKSGKHYKIGRSVATGQRQRQLAIQLPEKAIIVHEIQTDDPAGIERYWHGRFAEKRLNGEWFNLSRDDIAAFRRRKFM